MTRTPTRRLPALAAFALACALTSPATAQVLTEDAFRSTIVGTELTGMMGAHMTFQPGGTITGGFGGQPSITGTWRFDGPALCTTHQDGDTAPVSNCGVPELTKRHFTTDGSNGLRLQHNR